jgi:serine/threonine-protein kinase HipA
MVYVYLEQYGDEFLVGTLAQKEKKIYFEYDAAFISKNIHLSPYMVPLQKGLQVCEDRVFDGLYGLFADSLPDGWGRLLLDRYLISHGINYHDISPLERLCYIGKYGIGALRYEPSMQDLDFDRKDLILDDLAQASTNILEGQAYDMVESLLAIEGSSAGARPKIMAQINDQNDIIHGANLLQKGFEHYIVKFPNSSDRRNIGKIEYLYSLLANAAKIDIPNTKLLQGKQNSYFAIKRFDRIKDQKVHIHSVSGLTHSDFRYPSLDYDDLLGLTFHLTKDINEVYKLYRLAIFNFITHNRDDHGKNFSFLLDNKKMWRLAPAYDLTYSYGPNGEHSTTYRGEGKNPSKDDFVKLAQKHMIKNYQEIIDEVIDGILKINEFTKDIDLHKDDTKLLAGIFHKQCKIIT